MFGGPLFKICPPTLEQDYFRCISTVFYNRTFDTYSSTVTLLFSTDGANTARGFNISYSTFASDFFSEIPDNPRDKISGTDKKQLQISRNSSEADKFNALFKNFTDDYFSVYRNSDEEDYSDFRQTVTFNEISIKQYAHNRLDFVVQCSFDNWRCNEAAYFEEYIDPMYGKCFTFNSFREVIPILS